MPCNHLQIGPGSFLKCFVNKSNTTSQCFILKIIHDAIMYVITVPRRGHGQAEWSQGRISWRSWWLLCFSLRTLPWGWDGVGWKLLEWAQVCPMSSHFQRSPTPALARLPGFRFVSLSQLFLYFWTSLINVDLLLGIFLDPCSGLQTTIVIAYLPSTL